MKNAFANIKRELTGSYKETNIRLDADSFMQH